MRLSISFFYLLLLLAACKKSRVAMPDFRYDGKLYPHSSITFTSTQTDGNKLHWDFGDGSTSEDVKPVHIYMKRGDYTITLTIGDGDETQKLVKQITITLGLERIWLTKKWISRYNRNYGCGDEGSGPMPDTTFEITRLNDSVLIVPQMQIQLYSRDVTYFPSQKIISKRLSDTLVIYSLDSPIIVHTRQRDYWYNDNLFYYPNGDTVVLWRECEEIGKGVSTFYFIGKK